MERVRARNLSSEAVKAALTVAAPVTTVPKPSQVAVTHGR